MADRLDYFFRQKVTEAELDLGFELLEQADLNFANDIGVFGIIDGMVASEKAGVPDLSVDLTAPGRAYDQLGRRIFFGTAQNVDVSTDLNGVSTAVETSGNEKIVSVFIKFDRALSDPRTDGNSQQVFFRRDESFQFVVRQGAEAAAGSAVPPPLQPDEILIVDVTRTFGQTQILNSDLSPDPTVPGDVGRRQQFIFAEANAISIFSGGFATLDPVTDDVQAGFQEVDDELTDHFGATARRHDAPDVDAAATAGSPNALGAGTVRTQLDALLGHLNDHENEPSGAHTASAIAYAGGGVWADGATNPATTVEGQLDKLVADLAAATGAPKVGAAGTAGSPNALTAGTVKSQLDQLLGHVNEHENDPTAAHAASAIAYAGGGNWADGGTNPVTSVEGQLDKLVADLAAATGAPKVGADATAGSPNALIAGSVKSQLDELLGHINDHENDTSGAHAASAIAYAGGGNWADGSTNPATSVEGQLDKLISDLAAATGAPKVGAAATSGSPNSLTAGSAKSQLDELLGFINANAGDIAARVLKAGDTMTGNLLPSSSGLNLGSSSARWDLFALAVNASSTAQATRFIPTSDPQFVSSLSVLESLNKRNVVKAWASITSSGTLRSPHYNVSSVSVPATGRYSITLDVNPGSINAIAVTVNSGAFNADFSVHIFSPDGSTFEIDINSGGTLSNQAFMFVAVGS